MLLVPTKKKKKKEERKKRRKEKKNEKEKEKEEKKKKKKNNETHSSIEKNMLKRATLPVNVSVLAIMLHCMFVLLTTVVCGSFKFCSQWLLVYC